MSNKQFSIDIDLKGFILSEKNTILLTHDKKDMNE